MVSRSRRDRAQSSVVGVALLVGITMLALGTMAAAVGGVVDDAATDADVRRVTADFDRAFRPIETTGVHRARIQFGAGAITTQPRTVRVLDPNGTVASRDAAAITYSRTTDGGARADRRVTFLAGAILVTRGDHTRVVRPPPIASGNGVLVVGLPVVRGDVSVGGANLDLAVETHVTHARETLGDETWRVAVETTTPQAWNRSLLRRGARTTETTDFDDDGVPSVVATYGDDRTAHLVVHNLSVEVRQ